MLTDVHLYGHLADKYGAYHQFDVCSATEACRGLAANYRGFMQDFKDGYYDVFIGDRDGGTQLCPETINFRCRGRAIHIIPVAEGHRKGGGKAIVGVALLGIATFGAASAGLPWLTGMAAVQSGLGATALSLGGLGSLTWGNVALMGLSLAFNGISQMLTPSPKVSGYESRERPDQRASFLFNGPTNRSAEGAAIPLVYGEFEVGSIVASAGIVAEQLL